MARWQLLKIYPLLLSPTGVETKSTSSVSRLLLTETLLCLTHLMRTAPCRSRLTSCSFWQSQTSGQLDKRRSRGSKCAFTARSLRTICSCRSMTCGSTLSEDLLTKMARQWSRTRMTPCSTLPLQKTAYQTTVEQLCNLMHTSSRPTSSTRWTTSLANLKS